MNSKLSHKKQILLQQFLKLWHRNTLTLYIYVYINPFTDEDDVIANLFWSALLRNLPLVTLFNVHIKWHLQSACHLWKLFPQLLLASSFIPQFKCHFLQNGFPDCRLLWSAFSASVTTWLHWEQFSGLIIIYLSNSFLNDCFSHWTVNLLRTEVLSCSYGTLNIQYRLARSTSYRNICWVGEWMNGLLC